MFLLQFSLFQSVSPGQLDGDTEDCPGRQPLGQLEDVQPLAVTDVQVGPGVEKEDGDVVMFSDDCEVEGRVTLAVNMIRVRPLLQQLLL